MRVTIELLFTFETSFSYNGVVIAEPYMCATISPAEWQTGKVMKKAPPVG